MVNNFIKLGTNRQQEPSETLAVYYKRFTSLIEVVESRWGSMVPDDNIRLAAEEDKDDDEDDVAEDDSEDADDDEDEIRCSN